MWHLLDCTYCSTSPEGLGFQGRLFTCMVADWSGMIRERRVVADFLGSWNGVLNFSGSFSQKQVGLGERACVVLVAKWCPGMNAQIMTCCPVSAACISSISFRPADRRCSNKLATTWPGKRRPATSPGPRNDGPGSSWPTA